VRIRERCRQNGIQNKRRTVETNETNLTAGNGGNPSLKSGTCRTPAGRHPAPRQAETVNGGNGSAGNGDPERGTRSNVQVVAERRQAERSNLQAGELQRETAAEETQRQRQAHPGTAGTAPAVVAGGR